MNSEIWSALATIFTEHPVLRAESVPYEEIDAAAKANGFRLPADYREFVHRYGGAIVGPVPIVGLGRAVAMGELESSAFELTDHFRQQKWPGVDGWLIISMDHGGNPIGLDNDGKVWISDHDFGGVRKLAERFEDFLREYCLRP